MDEFLFYVESSDGWNFIKPYNGIFILLVGLLTWLGLTGGWIVDWFQNRNGKNNLIVRGYWVLKDCLVVLFLPVSFRICDEGESNHNCSLSWHKLFFNFMILLRFGITSRPFLLSVDLFHLSILSSRELYVLDFEIMFFLRMFPVSCE